MVKGREWMGEWKLIERKRNGGMESMKEREKERQREKERERESGSVMDKEGMNNIERERQKDSKIVK